MTYRFILAMMTVLAVSRCASAADAQSTVKVNGDVQDIVYLGSKHPVFIRVHLLVDGKGFRVLHRERAARLFTELDIDKNGHLDADESKRIPPPNQLSPDAQNSTFISDSIDLSPSDGKISKEELARYVAIVVGHPFRMRFALSSGERSTDLFTKLDRDGNLRLSKKELLQANQSLRKDDLDDDGAISRVELQPLADIPFGRADEDNNDEAEGPRHFHAITPYVLPKRVAESIVKTYSDPDSNAKVPALSFEVLGVSKEESVSFDDNKDGKLNQRELTQFLREPPPHVELTIKLPFQKFGFPRITGQSEQYKVTADKRRRSLGIDFNSVGIQMRVKSNRSMKYDNQQFYKSQFLQQDADKNRYLDEAEFNGLGIAGATFEMVDKNGDGMLYVEEVTEFVNRIADASLTRVVMTVTTTGKSLFDLLDTFRDARLTPRELADSFDRLTTSDSETQLPVDADRNGLITATEIDGQYRVTFEMGKTQLFTNIAQQMDRNMAGRVPSVANLSGPVWFQKMDKNRDGDVSRKEFLGSNKDFKKLDKNSDGLIDEAEASNASK